MNFHLIGFQCCSVVILFMLQINNLIPSKLSIIILFIAYSVELLLITDNGFFNNILKNIKKNMLYFKKKVFWSSLPLFQMFLCIDALILLIKNCPFLVKNAILSHIFD